jgi:outer membrane immunogenic protein
MNKILLSLAALALGATSAAADQPYNWSGLYLGAHAGYAWGSNEDGSIATRLYPDGSVEGAEQQFGNLTATEQSISDVEGFLGGVTIGANAQRGSFVFGVEADGSWGDLEGDAHLVTGAAALPGYYSSEGYSWDVNGGIDGLYTLRARLGVATGNTLFYATGGAAFAQTSADQTVTLDCPSYNCGYDSGPHVTATGSAEDDRWGWVLGGGIEHAVGNGWSFKAEYLHIDLGEATYNFAGTGYPVPPTDALPFAYSDDSLKTDITLDVLRVGVNYKFGGPSAAPLK